MTFSKSPVSAQTFINVDRLLEHLIAQAGCVGGVMSGPRGKQVIPIQYDKGSVDTLIAGHLAGRLPAMPSRVADAHGTFVTNADALAIYPVRAVNGSFVTTLLLFDIDGPGHADGLTDVDVHRVASSLFDLLERGGLAPIVARSGSGRGRHVLIVFSEPIDAGMARWLGEAVRDLVQGAGAVEIFPKQIALRPDQIGSAVTLPAMGAPAGVGGGARLDAAGKELPWSNIRCADPEVVAQLSTRWATYAQHIAEASNIERQAARFRTLASDAPNKADDFSDIGLEAVARAVATIADDRVTEAHVIGVICPTHGGSCFHIAPEQGWFFCHRCGHKGAGPAAALMLLRLFQPHQTDVAHRAFLEQLRASSCSANPAGAAS